MQFNPFSSFAESAIFSHSFNKEGNMIVLLDVYTDSNKKIASFEYSPSTQEFYRSVVSELNHINSIICDIALGMCIAYDIGFQNSLLETCPEEIFYEA